MKYTSPIERLVAEGKATPVTPEAEARLLEHMEKRYVPAAMSAQRRNRTDSEAIRDIPLNE